jgi:hypothetical protein
MKLGLSRFVSSGKLADRHHVVVVAQDETHYLVLPTTTVGVEASRAKVAGEFHPQDCAAAGWGFRCRACPEALQWVPKAWVTLRPGYGLTKGTTQALCEVARLYGKRAPRYGEDALQSLELRKGSEDKKRIRL